MDDPVLVHDAVINAADCDIKSGTKPHQNTSYNCRGFLTHIIEKACRMIHETGK